MNKKLAVIAICFLLVVGVFASMTYVANVKLKKDNQVLQNKVVDMQKEINDLKEYAGTLAGQHIGVEGVDLESIKDLKPVVK